MHSALYFHPRLNREEGDPAPRYSGADGATQHHTASRSYRLSRARRARTSSSRTRLARAFLRRPPRLSAIINSPVARLLSLYGESPQGHCPDVAGWRGLTRHCASTRVRLTAGSRRVDEPASPQRAGDAQPTSIRLRRSLDAMTCCAAAISAPSGPCGPHLPEPGTGLDGAHVVIVGDALHSRVALVPTSICHPARRVCHSRRAPGRCCPCVSRDLELRDPLTRPWRPSLTRS